MPSSTSSSNVNRRLPEQKIRWICLDSLLVMVCIVAGFEFALRQNGHHVAITDTANLWAIQRRRIDHADTKNQIVILGDSRAQMGLNPQVIEEHTTGKEIIMLAVRGSHSLPVIDDLAYQSDFAGTIICSFNANQSLYEIDTQKNWVGQYHQMLNNGSWVNEFLDQKIQGFFQARLVLCSFEPFGFIKQMIQKRQLPQPKFLNMNASRYMPVDYYRYGPAWLKACRDDRGKRIRKGIQKVTQEEKDIRWVSMIERLAKAVKKIQSRGGEVILVRMPTEGIHYQIVTHEHPRKLYWDTIQDRVGAKTIFFEDYPQLSGFKCPDMSHLNYDDADKYTASFIKILKKEKWLN